MLVSETPEWSVEVDARGLMCPLPLLKLKKGLQALEVGQVIRVMATDPASTLDFGVFVDQVGHTLVVQEQTEECLVFLIKKGP